MTWIDTFTGNPLIPVNPSYASITLTGNITLIWPINFVEGSPVATATMNVSSNNDTNSITLSSATQIGVGTTLIFNNVGAESFILKNNGAVELATLSPGDIYYIYNTDNSTDNGEWSIVHFGVGTSSPDAGALAGNGLIALASKLNTNWPSQVLTDNFILTDTDRSNLIIWNGGEGTGLLPAPSSVGAGYFVAINNFSTSAGVLTLTASGGALIDNEPTLDLLIEESLILVSTGTKYSSIGWGKSAFNAVNIVSIDVAGSENITITPVQAANQLIQFNGALTGNITVTFPNVAFFYTFINNTTGNFTLKLKTTGGTNEFLLPQTELYNAINTGAEILPVPTTNIDVYTFAPNWPSGWRSIRFSTDDNTTGWDSVNPNIWRFSSAGNVVLYLGEAGIEINPTQGTYTLGEYPIFSLMEAYK